MLVKDYCKCANRIHIPSRYYLQRYLIQKPLLQLCYSFFFHYLLFMSDSVQLNVMKWQKIQSTELDEAGSIVFQYYTKSHTREISLSIAAEMSRIIGLVLCTSVL